MSERRGALNLVVEYRILVRQIQESLETYDSDDGHNDLVLAGITAEAKRLESAFERIWPRRPLRRVRKTRKKGRT